MRDNLGFTDRKESTVNEHPPVREFRIKEADAL